MNIHVKQHNGFAFDQGKVCKKRIKGCKKEISLEKEKEKGNDSTSCKRSPNCEERIKTAQSTIQITYEIFMPNHHNIPILFLTCYFTRSFSVNLIELNHHLDLHAHFVML